MGKEKGVNRNNFCQRETFIILIISVILWSTMMIRRIMQTLTINIKNKKVADEITQLLENYRKEDLEIISVENLEDLKLLKNTRHEDAISFDEYLKNEDKNS